MTLEANPTKALAFSLPNPHPKKIEVLLYYTFYMPKVVVVLKEEFNFSALIEVKREEVLLDNFSKHKMGGPNRR